MSEILRIRGGVPLNGDAYVSGSKNAAVALIPAALLGSSPSTIENLPDIDDVYCLMRILRWLGADVTFERGVMRIDPSGVTRNNPPYEMVSRMRASYYLVPTLAGRLGSAEVPMPGGCDIGNRPIDQTIKGLTSLGLRVNTEGGIIRAEKTPAFGGNEVFLAMPSVGATINTMLAAVSAPGKTYIHNAAKEPHIVDTANFLSSMGARIKGAGTDVIRITGGLPLHGSTYTVIPDQIETGTLMIAAAATRGDVTLHGTIPTHMESLTAKLLEMGVYVTDEDDVIRVRASGNLRPVTLRTQVYPGFPTDLQQPLTAMLTVAWGTSYITENIFENRFRYVDELRRMGADIKVFDRTAVVQGVEKLHASSITATDLRAGAAMIVAALMTEGTSDISGVQYIMRGYEHIDEKLRRLGADARYIG
ncbi:MAG: UDP-N-acetylglucosamine 1-carboxyvinyltransferase [Clostridia bacterium]|nr:UDP-N-acetylglucosamine 1-carboxyvinyltransferase [Clostridia bacterium]